MPLIHVHMYEGKNLDQKRQLVSAVTQAVVRSLDCPPEAVRIVIHENPKQNFAAAGILASEKK